MRLSIIACLASALLFLVSTGCQSFKNPFDSKAGSLLGMNRNKTEEVDSDDLLDPLGARNSNRLVLDDLAPSQIATTIRVRTGGGSKPKVAEAAYDKGQALYTQAIQQLEADPNSSGHQELFTQAANQFRIAAASWPESAIEEDSLFFEGESCFFADRYVQANRAFEKLIKTYPGSKHLDMAENRRYAVAVYWLQLSENASSISFTDAKRPKTGLAGEARRILHRIRIDDPTGKLADDATLTLGKAFMRAERYYEAADTLEDLRKNYPGSKHQFDAHMLELEARLASYQGASYDDAPLVKADQILKSLVRQFPQQSKDNMDYLEKQATVIRNMMAQRDLTLAQYYENRDENLAAKFHYEKIEKQFDGTAIADEVRERIADVSAKPPHPKQHLKMLVDLFPDPEKAKPMIRSGDNESLFR